MVKSQLFITFLHLLLLTSIATVSSRPTTLSRRGISEHYCDPLLGDCGDQWPFSPISSTTNNNPFISRPFLRRQTLPTLPPVLVPSPPPATVSDPTFSPLVASPPPPGTTIIPPAFPELPPDDNDDDFDDTNAAPPADVDNYPPEVTLPPIVHRSQPDLYLSPPQLNLPSPDLLGQVPAPPLVPILSQQKEIVMPPPPANK